ncbi:DUF2500 family protein [Clostridium sp. CF012]|uniref:DUF2500 family protein n=1 Tax=Clostridium sp. CF012 TaxID=2843319 RepID=UPI001C0E85E0|nr:DUF2500 family protein [Clostridium sp. CF012]MBU3146295.1 DUF2500 domain-containing protein [Clostridium sp. CF012]
MSSSQNVFFTVKRGILILILYSITIMVYFTCFYKPLELIASNLDIPEIASANEILKSINRDDIMFFFIFSFLGVVAILLIVTFIYQEIVLCTKPIIAVNARLKSKESVMQMSGDYMGFSSVGYNYKLIFETDNEVEMVFVVVPKYYATIMEGNKGILKYKQGRLNRFIGFDLKSID